VESGRRFPSSLWKSAFVADFHSCGTFHSLFRPPLDRSVFGVETRDGVRAIADTGGVIGVVAVPFFLTDNKRPTIEHMLDHIDYIVALVGWQHVAIGTDWPMQAPDAVLRSTLTSETSVIGFRAEDRIDVTRRLEGFDDCRDLPNITRGLVKRGYGDEQIRGILGENALRVFAEVCR
jgi:membrane dipeptidase